MEIGQHLGEDEKPSSYLTTLLQNKTFQKEPFRELFLLSRTEQSPKYHPEGSAWVHTLMVVDEAAKVKEKSSHPEWFMWAAFLHDIGKAKTTRLRHGRITSYGHDEEGEALARNLVEQMVENEEEIQYIVALVRYHMHILYITKGLPYGRPKAMASEADIKEIALLGWCDQMGRTNAVKEEVEERIRLFYKKMKGFCKA